jgi:hypothetical protein
LLACAPIIVSVSSGSPCFVASTRAMPSATKESKMPSCTSAREGQVHTSPWFRENIAKPSSALS